MEQLRTLLANIRRQLGALTSTQKLLIGSLVVIMLMTLFLVSQYAGKAELVQLLPGATPEEQQKADAALTTAGIPHKSGMLGVMIAPSKREEAFAALSQTGNQPANTAIIFENILKTQNWMNSREQNRQVYKVMLDNWLGGVLSKFAGIKSAQVFVDAPEPSGIGTTAKKPKASITLFSSSGKLIPQETVDAAARLVAGSVAGLDIENVTVNDATTGRPRRPTTDAELLPATYLEFQGSVEKQLKGKLESLLRYMDPPPVVEVSASVDVTRVRGQVTKILPVSDGSLNMIKSETTTSKNETQGSSGAEPGAQSNVKMDINTGSAKGTKKDETETKTEYEAKVGTETKSYEDPRGFATRLVATVAVPRAFIVSLWQKENPAKEGEKPKEPTAADIATRFNDEKKDIEQSLKPHVVARTPEGQEVQGIVEVRMVAGDAIASSSGGGGSGGAGGAAPAAGGLGAIGTLLATGGSGLIDRAVVGVLALVAVGMMFLMVRRTGKRTVMPSATEMVGRPPTLEAKSDLVGEADESETAMAGIEVGEEQIKADKMREQVAELVKQNPEGASKLLHRWISVEE